MKTSWFHIRLRTAKIYCNSNSNSHNPQPETMSSKHISRFLITQLFLTKHTSLNKTLILTYSLWSASIAPAMLLSLLIIFHLSCWSALLCFLSFTHLSCLGNACLPIPWTFAAYCFEYCPKPKTWTCQSVCITVMSGKLIERAQRSRPAMMSAVVYYR